MKPQPLNYPQKKTFPQKDTKSSNLLLRILAIPYYLLLAWGILYLFFDFLIIDTSKNLLWQSTKLMLVWYFLAYIFSIYGNPNNIQRKMYLVNHKIYHVQDLLSVTKIYQKYNRAFYIWWTPFPIIYSWWPTIIHYWEWGFSGYPNLDHFLIIVFLIGFLILYINILYRTYNEKVKKRLNFFAIVCSLPYGLILLFYFVGWLLKS